MKIKSYVAVLLSHLAVLIALLTPIIRVSEIKMTLTGEKSDEASLVNFIEFIVRDPYNFTSVLMLVLVGVHIMGVANALFGIIKKKYSHSSINFTFYCSFASALMGALHLYSKSYALFFICAVSFLVIAFCSIKLIKSEG